MEDKKDQMNRREFLRNSGKMAVGVALAHSALGILIPQTTLANDVKPKEKIDYKFNERSSESISKLLDYPGLNAAKGQDMAYKAYFAKGG